MGKEILIRQISMFSIILWFLIIIGNSSLVYSQPGGFGFGPGGGFPSRGPSPPPSRPPSPPPQPKPVPSPPNQPNIPKTPTEEPSPRSGTRPTVVTPIYIGPRSPTFDIFRGPSSNIRGPILDPSDFLKMPTSPAVSSGSATQLYDEIKAAIKKDSSLAVNKKLRLETIKIATARLNSDTHKKFIKECSSIATAAFKLSRYLNGRGPFFSLTHLPKFEKIAQGTTSQAYATMTSDLYDISTHASEQIKVNTKLLQDPTHAREIISIIDKYDCMCLNKGDTINGDMKKEIDQRVGVLFWPNFNPKINCTATAISPNWILTAAHCVFKNFEINPTMLPFAQAYFLPYSDSTPPIKLSGNIIHALAKIGDQLGYATGKVTDDWVLLELSSPLNIKKHLTFISAFEGQGLIMHGHQRLITQRDNYVNIHHFNDLEMETGLLQRIYRKYARTDSTATCSVMFLGELGTFTHSCQTEAGTSGAPLFAYNSEKTELQLIGIHVQDIDIPEKHRKLGPIYYHFVNLGIFIPDKIKKLKLK